MFPESLHVNRNLISLCVAIAITYCLAYFFYLSVHLRQLAARTRAPSPSVSGVDWPMVSVITPFRGIEPAQVKNLHSILDQDYPNFEYILVVPSERDRAYPVLQAAAARHPGRAKLCVADAFAYDRSDQMNNIMTAIGQVDPDSEILVLYMSDHRVRPFLLRSLVLPILSDDAAVTTSTLWFEPRNGSFVEWMHTMWVSIASALQTHPHHTLPWGGAMAVRWRLLNELGADAVWRGAMGPDNTLGHLLRKRGLRTTFVAPALEVEPARQTWGSFMSWGRRQLFHLRTSLRLDWISASLSMILLGPAPLALLPWTVATAIAASWDMTHTLLVAYSAVLLSGVFACTRNYVVGMEQMLQTLGFDFVRLPRRALLFSPLAVTLMAIHAVGSAVGRRSRWGPVVYDVLAFDRTRVVGVDAEIDAHTCP